jgi:hypothetical protein
MTNPTSRLQVIISIDPGLSSGSGIAGRRKGEWQPQHIECSGMNHRQFPDAPLWSCNMTEGETKRKWAEFRTYPSWPCNDPKGQMPRRLFRFQTNPGGLATSTKRTGGQWPERVPDAPVMVLQRHRLSRRNHPLFWNIPDAPVVVLQPRARRCLASVHPVPRRTQVVLKRRPRRN